MQLVWHGDVDFGTDALQSTYKSYLDRLDNIDDALKQDVHSRLGRMKILNFLCKEPEQITRDVAFITGGRLCKVLTK